MEQAQELKLLAKLVILFIISTSLWAKPVTCVRDRKFQFSTAGSQSVGKITIYNRYQNGECSLTLSITRKTDNGQTIDEQFTFSDLGRLGTFISSTKSFKTSRNSRATGSRSFYLLPKKRENVSYEIKADKIIINMANGEQAIFDTNSGNIVDITNTKWRRDKALRSYVRKEKVIAQDVYSKECANCSLKYKVKYDKFIYSTGSLLIDGVDQGVVLATKFRRGSDGRLPTLWGHKQKVTILDRRGKRCVVNNQDIFKYKYEQFGRKKSIDKIFLKDITNQEMHKRLKRLCGNKISFKTPHNTSCPSCPNTVNQALPHPPTKSIKDLFKHINTTTPRTITPPSIKVQKGAFRSKANALKLIQKEHRRDNKCRLSEGSDFFRVFCQR